MPRLPVNPNLEFLLDEATGSVVHSQMLGYCLSWYNPGRVVAVVPRNDPSITYLVDLEENNGKMRCSCDAFMFQTDPQMTGYNEDGFQPCRHILLVRLVLKRGLLGAPSIPMIGL